MHSFGKRAADQEAIGRAPLVDRRKEEDRRHVQSQIVVERRVDLDRRAGPRREVPGNLVILAANAPLSEVEESDRAAFCSATSYAPSGEVRSLKQKLLPKVVALAEQVYDTLIALPPAEVKREMSSLIAMVMERENVVLSALDQKTLATTLMSELIGFGPLDPLLADPSITDILVNGPDNVWIERNGLLELCDVNFDSNQHLLNIIQRIVSQANRHVDESCPLVDARLPDGSRVNVIIPPASYRFPSVSIRKFKKNIVTLDHLVKLGTLSFEMRTFLKMIAKYRLNVLISGGTGSGKTTLLSAMTYHISGRERIVTIEDTAELQLQQPDVVSLERRPPNIEGKGEITVSDLVVNALRMRPDRILVGEVRGAEAADMLQAMNTGHDGSIGTIHANSPQDALMRFEYMACMSGRYTPGAMVREQITSAIDLIVHLDRMRDGVRRITEVTELAGRGEETFVCDDIFRYRLDRETEEGKLEGAFENVAAEVRCLDKIRRYNLSSEEMDLVARLDQGRLIDRGAA